MHAPHRSRHCCRLCTRSKTALMPRCNTMRYHGATRIGARLELQFCAIAPINAKEARTAQQDELERAIHLFLLNHGLLLTPFHNMMLVCPATSAADISKLLRVLGECLTTLIESDIKQI